MQSYPRSKGPVYFLTAREWKVFRIDRWRRFSLRSQPQLEAEARIKNRRHRVGLGER